MNQTQSQTTSSTKKQTSPHTKIPGPPVLPLIGNAPWVIHREGILQGFLRLSDSYRGEGLFRIVTPGGTRPIFVVNASLAAELLDESKYQKTLQGPLLRIRDFAGDGLFTAYPHEENWGKAHRIVSPGFTADSMERYFPSMLEISKRLLATWRSASEPVDVVPDMIKLTLDTISLSGFNKDFQSFREPALHPFLQSLGRALQESVNVLKRPVALSFLYSRQRRKFAQDTALMFASVDEVIAERKKLPKEEWPKDFLSLMLGEKDPKTGETLSDENIRYQVLTFLIAGHETTAGLLSFLLHQLAINPQLQQQVRDEVAQVIGDGEPTRVSVLKLSLIMRCIQEALRLWPTVPVFSVAPIEDIILGGKWEIPKGMPVSLLVSAIHRDPVVWPDPLTFDPDRFLPEQARQRPASAYKPFGNGKRSCTGRIFAMVETALAIAMIVREFNLSTDKPLKIAPTVSPKPNDFRLKLERR